jgi:DNA-directed RNA polymerase alpha subunit
MTWLKPQMTERIDPTPQLSGDTPIDSIRLPTRILNVLANEGLKTVGEVRAASDAMLVSLPDLGPRSVAFLRKFL